MSGMRRARLIIQLLALAITNPQFGNFLAGKIYRGELKNFCAPGLNCHSCPAAIFACPIGALQAVEGAAGFRFSFYAAGFLLIFGAILGRAICGFLCPFGLVQELLYKIPCRKFELWRPLIFTKYFALIIFVLIIPATVTNFAGTGEPFFCQYICPAGTLEAGFPLIAAHEEFRQILGKLFALKFSILAATIFGSVLVYRFFCKAICPLGAVYGLLNRLSIYRLNFDENLCVNCGACEKICKMNLNPARCGNSAECIRCGDCAKICPRGAIKFSFDFRSRL